MKRLFATSKTFLPRLFSTSNNVTLTVDGITVNVPKGTLLVDAIRSAGVDVPTMCYHSDLKNSGGICRICLVDDLSRPDSAPPLVSCRTPVTENMKISTRSGRLFQYRATNESLMLKNHPTSCLSCAANTKCETQNAAARHNNHSSPNKQMLYEPAYTQHEDRTTALNRYMDLCIGCDRCIQACRTQCNVYEWENKGYHGVETFGLMKNNECVQCGQCINRCPTGALTESSEIKDVLAALRDKDKHVVFQIAPAIRASIAEEFGLPAGERILKNELVTGLKMLGPNVTVLDTDYAADQTIMEEASELIERMARGLLGKPYLSPEKEYNTTLPMFTSCCPGWVTFMEKNYPDMLDHMSSCKSPMQMQSALIKTYWAKEIKKIDPKKIVNVAVMPCNAKKMEKDRPDMRTKDFKWTDYVLTNRETAKMFKEAGINPTKLPKTDFDKVMGQSTGAGVIFGATGGVLEAALRTGYEVITGRSVPFKGLNITPIRGMEGVREAEIVLSNVKPEFKELEGFKLKVAVAHGFNNARQIVDKVKAAKLAGKEMPWHFIEVMACPGGCLGGGGQPKPTSLEIRKGRAKLIYQEDENLPLRKSHDNPEIIQMYKNFLGHPLSERAHHLLHREYKPFTEFHSSLYPDRDPKAIEEVLAKYPKKEQEYLLPIIIDITDKKGSLSIAHMQKIADHVGVKVGRVNAIVSNYHYFHRSEEQSHKPHLYLCTCHNCMMKGQQEILSSLKRNKGNFELSTMNWLGVCVNDAPAAMVKRPGLDYVEYLSGLKPSNLKQKIFGNMEQHLVTKIPSRIKLYPFSRLEGSPPSLFDEMSWEEIRDVVQNAAQLKPENLLKQLEFAKLQGRGGAGFFTFRKWESARNYNHPTKYVVCNADEGLPSTFKDFCILENANARKRMIAGMNICAKFIGAKNAYVYLRYEYRNLAKDIVSSGKEFARENPEYADISLQVRIGGGPYVAGEETAQFESIQGEAPIPRKDRPYNVFATMNGLFSCPTVINNVETFCAVPYILKHSETGLLQKHGLPKLFGVTGDIEAPAMLEYALHSQDTITLNRIISEIGAKDITAAEVGGSTEPLVKQALFDKKIAFEWGALNAVGSIVLFDDKRNLKDIYVNKLEFMVSESCKQCVPCREGSKVLRDAIRSLSNHEEPGICDKVLNEVAEAAAYTSICAHGKSLLPLFKAARDEMMQGK